MTYRCKKDASTLNIFLIRPCKLDRIFIIARCMLGLIMPATISTQRKLLTTHLESLTLPAITVDSLLPKDSLKSQNKLSLSHFHFSLAITKPRALIMSPSPTAYHSELIKEANSRASWNLTLCSQQEVTRKI